MSWLDPAADPARKAWIGHCQDWCYLLTTDRAWLWLQCPQCGHRWWHDTSFRYRGDDAA